MFFFNGSSEGELVRPRALSFSLAKEAQLSASTNVYDAQHGCDTQADVAGETLRGIGQAGWFGLARLSQSKFQLTSEALNFLGKACHLLSCGALQCFGDDCQLYTHPKASLWKGYIKVADTLLDQMLNLASEESQSSRSQRWSSSREARASPLSANC